MPTVPSISPATGQEITNDAYIHTINCNFVDNHGRTLLLRGVNLSGSSKAPVDSPSYVLDDFWESGERGDESFFDRPLNIDDGTADVHLARLRGWGFNMLRFPVTWEALEHEGPGKYDDEFMDYIVCVLRKCKDYGFKIYMDPHQDTWSRFSGGSGAPFWTLAACGINPRNFTATQAAILHAEYPLAHDPDPASLPAMIWSTNYGRLASQTIFTLFFAGRDFAPKCIIDGKNIQDYLQEHYIEAMGHMADRIRDAGDLIDECVIGWDSLNEPFEGLCGWLDLNVYPTKQGSTLKKGTYPTPAQSLRLGMGQVQTVDNWSFGAFGPVRDGTVTIDPKGLKIWAERDIEVNGVHPRWGWTRDEGWELGTCIWALHGVWDIETGYIIRPDYFRYLPDVEEPLTEVEFIDDYWRPHWEIFAKRIRQAHPEAIMFIQPPVFAPPPPINESELKGRCVLSTHYYDGLTLVTRHWNWFNADALGLLRGKYSSTLQAVKIGERSIRKSLQEQLGILKSDATILGGGRGKYPTIIGEIGTPFDMDDKRSYGWTDGGKHKGDYSRQERALDASLNGCDGVNALNWTIWTYCPDSSHDWGDGWNMEDLSLWCEDDLQDKEQEEGQIQGQESSLYGMGDSSQAGLLRKKTDREEVITTITAVPTAANSTLTLDTLGPSSNIMSIRDRPHSPKTPRELAGWHENPYDFLTDGARAVRAFCRPWPHKVVGTPVDMQFNVSKAEFKLVVRVQSQDRPSPGADKPEEELGTEIFVPLVHYASDAVLGGSRQRGLHAYEESGSDGGGLSPKNVSTINLETILSRPEPSSPTDMSASTSTITGAGSDVLDLRISGGDLVEVEVKVSCGRWAVEGQMLKWWYDVPLDGEEAREEWIEIRRSGGAIRLTESGGICSDSWLDSFCPPEAGCTIM